MDKDKMCPSKSCRRCIYLEKSHVQFGANLKAKYKSKMFICYIQSILLQSTKQRLSNFARSVMSWLRTCSVL